MKNEFEREIPIFYGLAEVLFKWLQKSHLPDTYFQKIESRLKFLYPVRKRKELLKQYMCYKLMLVLVGLIAGSGLLMLCVVGGAGHDLEKLIVLVLICLPLLFFAQDEKLEKKRKEKEEQMIMDYPVLLNKLIIYIGAGFTVRRALEKIGSEYAKEKKMRNYERYGYEEVLYLCRELQGGVGERKSMEHFGERCGVQCYRRFSMLLLQNMKKGCDELTFLLRRESIQALELRKHSARKRGEEAGTKLLIPMILMMCTVFMLLIVPAWMSFQI